MNPRSSCDSTGAAYTSIGKWEPGAPLITYIGKRFGKLVVLSVQKQMFICRCDCGVEKPIRAHNVLSDRQKSCSCERGVQRDAKNFEKNHKREYRAWIEMRRRCYGKGKHTKNYGDRGISVCDRWDDFECFLEDMGKCPEGLTLDRIRVNDDYEPGNCRWLSMEEQLGNKRCTLWVEYQGEKMCLRKACRLSGVKYHSVAHQPKRGIKTPQEALDTALLKLKG